MCKKYDSTLLVQIEAPAIIRSFRTEQKSEMIEQIEVSATPATPIELVMDYMQKRMDQIDQTRRSFKAQYPDLLPAIACGKFGKPTQHKFKVEGVLMVEIPFSLIKEAEDQKDIWQEYESGEMSAKLKTLGIAYEDKLAAFSEAGRNVKPRGKTIKQISLDVVGGGE